MRDAHDPPSETKSEEVRSVEAVVETQSPLVDRTAGALDLQHRYGIKLLEISRKGGQVTEGLGEIWVQAGNLLVLQAGEGALAETLRNLGLLALAERTVTIGDRRRPCGPILVLATTLTLVAAKLLTLQSHSSPPQCSSL